MARNLKALVPVEGYGVVLVGLRNTPTPLLTVSQQSQYPSILEVDRWNPHSHSAVERCMHGCGSCTAEPWCDCAGPSLQSSQHCTHEFLDSEGGTGMDSSGVETGSSKPLFGEHQGEMVQGR